MATTNNTIDKPLVIVLDLDETLIHTTEVAINNIWDESLEIRKNSFSLNNGSSVVICKIRPYAREFLYICMKYFDFVCIWTAATNDYAHEVVNSLVPMTKINKIKLIMSRDHCDQHKDYSYHKPISSVSKMLGMNCDAFLVDDRAKNMMEFPYNGILIKAYTGDDNDNKLEIFSQIITRCSNKNELLTSMISLSIGMEIKD